MNRPSRPSLEEELQNICDQIFENFCNKYGDKSTWEELDPSKTYVPSFYLRGHRHIHSKKSIKSSAVKRLDFTICRPNTKYPSGDFQTNQPKLSTSIKESVSTLKQLNFPIKKSTYPPAGDSTKGDVPGPSSTGVKFEKENVTNQSRSSIKDISAENVEQISTKSRFPLNENSPGVWYPIL
ncbi:unnamed protein product [Rodentolepis nana]|uniref:Uncharacterized protein n=1 Tax=Rodentolepis nana TaxID=102285 RepID=A0A0R3TIG2_RODNA|nr:unnamed protein product [Rodentolepis nana]